MCIWLDSFLSSFANNNFTIGHCVQSFQSNFFISSVVIDAIDRHHFMGLVLAMGHKVSGKQDLFGSVSCTILSWSAWNLIWNWSSLVWIPFYSKNYVIKDYPGLSCFQEKVMLSGFWEFMNWFLSNHVWSLYWPLYFDTYFDEWFSVRE